MRHSAGKNEDDMSSCHVKILRPHVVTGTELYTVETNWWIRLQSFKHGRRGVFVGKKYGRIIGYTVLYSAMHAQTWLPRAPVQDCSLCAALHTFRN